MIAGAAGVTRRTQTQQSSKVTVTTTMTAAMASEVATISHLLAVAVLMTVVAAENSGRWRRRHYFVTCDNMAVAMVATMGQATINNKQTDRPLLW